MMNEWQKTDLDLDTYIAELRTDGALSITNDHIKQELDLSPRATYDLLIFLQRHAAQIYRTIREPKEVYPSYDEQEHRNQVIILPTKNEGETIIPKESDRVLYGDVNDPYLFFVRDVVVAWAEHAYNGPAIITRIDNVAFIAEQKEPVEESEFLHAHRNWTIPQGTPDQAWRVTIWPQWGYKSFLANHIYVHRYGEQLWTARSEWQSGAPHYLWLPEDEAEYE